MKARLVKCVPCSDLQTLTGSPLSTKHKVPVRPCSQTGTKWGMGVRQALFPGPALGAAKRGCRLPDAILHGKRSYRPRSRAVRRLAATGLLSEAFQLA
jgi:hypothetical protein